jgi:hypothetical protein
MVMGSSGSEPFGTDERDDEIDTERDGHGERDERIGHGRSRLAAEDDIAGEGRERANAEGEKSDVQHMIDPRGACRDRYVGATTRRDVEFGG